MEIAAVSIQRRVCDPSETGVPGSSEPCRVVVGTKSGPLREQQALSTTEADQPVSASAFHISVLGSHSACSVHLTSSPAALSLCFCCPVTVCRTGLVSLRFRERTLYLGQDWGFCMKSDLSIGRSVAVLWLYEDVIRWLARWATQSGL